MNKHTISKKYLYLIALLQTLLIDSALSKEWEPEALVNMTKKNDLIVDTKNYIDKSGESYKTILNYAQEIQDVRRFSVYIYFIDSMSSQYRSGYFSVRNDIERFVNDIAWHLVKGKIENDKDSLIILFSIEDRQNRIRTGENVRKYLKDDKALNYLKNLKSKMRGGDYTGALEDLMYNVNWRITKDTSFYDFLENLFAFVVLIGLCVFCCVMCAKKQDDPYNQRDYIAESKLEKIKKISEKNKNNVKFVEENCIICLEEFNAQEKAELMKEKEKDDNGQIKKSENENHEELLKSNVVDLGFVQNNLLENNTNINVNYNGVNGLMLNKNNNDLNYANKTEKVYALDKKDADDVIRVNDLELGKRGIFSYFYFASFFDFGISMK